MRERVGCWICGCADTRLHSMASCPPSFDDRSFRITDSRYGETHGLRRCPECDFLYADSLPNKNLVEYYENMQDPEYLESAGTRRIQARRLLATIIRYHKSARSLLDIGAGLGLLVMEARACGMSADGVEPSRWLVEKAMERFQISLHLGTIEEFRDVRKFDVVAMTDVIEHTDDPILLLRQACERLAPNGMVVVVTPMRDSLAAKLMGKRWWHYRVAHVGYFTRRSMRRALEANGLSPIADPCVGWYFPASYVCARLKRYLSYWPANALLGFMENSARLQHYIIPLNLFDSRMFLAKKRPLT